MKSNIYFERKVADMINNSEQLEQTIVDKNFQEIKQHGTVGFPFAMYKDDLNLNMDL